MDVNDIMARDPDIMSGALVFKGTRVPVEALFGNLASGMSLAEFLDNFPTVTREQVEGALVAASEDLERLVA
ncbi:DUF433 domain-containing protein [Jiella pacifica]|uniref:DUF433 domain-containing protein n=1 Tax=Jiella pacifica TaxID=2696469 RepID=A0A6N9T145_9HYPH|nr:DUF433 domain-containing protein [Jiella pacifica]NDW05044.1 DUF433 domain-containing protein [Jiella pacifica]